MKRPATSRGYPITAWVGLLWVYGAAWFVFAAVQANNLGWPAGIAAALLRLAATLAIGVGLCATERWAWGPAVSLSGFYTVLAAALAVRATAFVAAPPPGTLSWMPVFLGLNLAGCGRAAFYAWGAALLSLGTLVVLWRTQPQFDIPFRRAYSVMVRFGLAPALLVIALDAYLLWGWWHVWAGL